MQLYGLNLIPMNLKQALTLVTAAPLTYYVAFLKGLL